LHGVRRSFVELWREHDSQRYVYRFQHKRRGRWIGEQQRKRRRIQQQQQQQRGRWLEQLFKLGECIQLGELQRRRRRVLLADGSRPLHRVRSVRVDVR
jgi:hypothetical protein